MTCMRNVSADELLAGSDAAGKELELLFWDVETFFFQKLRVQAKP